MARKVFISFLGETNYGECDYQKDGISYGGKLRFIQEATLNYLNATNEWAKDDIAYILLTKGAEEKNWLDNGQTKYGSDEKIIQSGLQTQLRQMNLAFPVEPIKDIPEGNDEREIWIIFEKIFDHIRDNDELYFDVTHGYRYLPMLFLVLSNYAKFLKKVTVKSITYGNYEISERGTKPGLIVDLLPLTVLQDWTYAAGQYLDSGNVERLKTLCNNELNPILANSKGKNQDAQIMKRFIETLSDVIAERQTCRGMNIIQSKNFVKLKTYADEIQTTLIPPLDPIFEKIKHSLVYFDEQENIKNGFSAAVWCYQNGLFQQAATILQEFVVTFFCVRHNIKIDNENLRETVNFAFNIQFNGTVEKEWRGTEEQIIKIREILSDDLLYNHSLVNYFNNLTEVRNDFNHSGMRSKRAPLSAVKIKDNIKKCIEGIATILYNVNPLPLC